MPERYRQLRREMQANFELTWAGQAESNHRLERISARLDYHADQIEEHGLKIEEQGRVIHEQGRRIAEQGRQISSGLKETARLGREVVANGHQMVGRFRLMDDRFGKFLDVLESEAMQQRQELDELERRVARLEQGQGPAA